jgi:predicted acyl esterase
MDGVNEPTDSARGVPMFTAPEIRRWWSYNRPAGWETMVTALRVSMSDGIELDCDLVCPGRDGLPVDGPFPGLVFELTPYAVMRDLCILEASWFAARGYVAVVGNVRGTGDSGGEWMHAMSGQDGLDARTWWNGSRPSRCAAGVSASWGRVMGGRPPMVPR